MAKILVTGATGRLGSTLLPLLLAKGHSVRALVRPGSQKPLMRGVERFEFDLSSGKPPQEAYAGVQKVIHLSGLVGEYPFSQLMSQNAYATQNLVAACPSSVENIILASSISIYGEYAGQLVDETFTLQGESQYGKSKLMAEMFAKEYADAFPIVALRFGMIYGPGFTEGYYAVFERLMKRKMSIIGNGKNRLPLVHSEDAIEAILLSLDFCKTGFHPYNIVGAETATQEEVFGMAASALKVPAPKGKTPQTIANIGIGAAQALSIAGICKKPSINSDNLRQLCSDRAYSGAKAQKELGFGASVKLSDGINQMARIFLSSRKEQG
ncbi:MAG: NAD-dependent epimerase/dehydratase family protein [Candidatus Micrarchaeota archaeon]|nr:NAD-dependent epimerase/dehydratase family protein [Candidatus Micrarchaeota archaeon]